MRGLTRGILEGRKGGRMRRNSLWSVKERKEAKNGARARKRVV